MMITTSEQSIQDSSGLSAKAKALFELMKFRLSALVTFSGVIGFCLGAPHVIWTDVLLFAIAALAITGSANTINQIFEKDLDKLMKRTCDRPLPTGRLTVNEAIIWAVFLGVLATAILVLFFNIRAAALALFSLVLYGFVYTRLKRVGSVAVLVGAFPGAFPPMIGWIAATNHFGLEPGILFAIQFFWQFPHFWAIAWVLDDEYKKAGFNLLPSQGGKDLNTAIQIMINALLLIPIGWLPYKLGMTGINSAFIATVFGVLFLAQTFHLMRKCNDRTALQLMFGSFAYLPIVQIAFLLDKV
ncbi:heme o synthase [Ravibacter arvi]|uniref:Protoheme IX farnesyltransferase n=2 Tax=Ravibacter arvi TaxID=2051041 RepID=A0ABP8MCV5_9BACT